MSFVSLSWLLQCPCVIWCNWINMKSKLFFADTLGDYTHFFFCFIFNVRKLKITSSQPDYIFVFVPEYVSRDFVMIAHSELQFLKHFF